MLEIEVHNNDDPVWLKRLLGWFLILTFVFGIIAETSSRFVPNTFGVHIGLAFAAVSTAVGAYFGANSMAKYQGTKPRLTMTYRVVGLAFVTFLLGWSAAMEPLGLFTSAVGTPGLQREVSAGWRSERISVGQCSGPNIAGMPVVDSVCVDSSRAHELDTGAPLVLTGKISQVGINVSAVE